MSCYAQSNNHRQTAVCDCTLCLILTLVLFSEHRPTGAAGQIPTQASLLLITPGPSLTFAFPISNMSH